MRYIWRCFVFFFVCFISIKDNCTDGYDTGPSNKLFIAVLPQMTHAVCRAAAELYAWFGGSALTCGISADLAQNHEEMHDISVLNHRSAAGTKEGLSFRFTPQGRGVTLNTTSVQSGSGQSEVHPGISLADHHHPYG